jgi:hypothetical protein
MKERVLACLPACLLQQNNSTSKSKIYDPLLFRFNLHFTIIMKFSSSILTSHPGQVNSFRVDKDSLNGLVS